MMLYSKRKMASSVGLGIIFIGWGIISWATNGVIPGTIWMAFAGFWILFGGITDYYKDLYRMNLVVNVLKVYPRISIRDLAKQTRMSRSRVLRLVNALRAEGRLKAHFDPKTGDLIVFEVDGVVPGQVPAPQQQPLAQPVTPVQPQPVDYKICPYCGNLVPKDAKFCTFCGASLD